MKNRFYNEFDLTRLEQSKRQEDYRTPFQIDRDRIIYSSEFRRMQAKTQVFLPGEYDFYRTRLTHSIEVAQIGRSLCNYLNTRNDLLSVDDYFIDPILVEGICLAHDLGHPPFGHAGERTINKLMKESGAFEGNAQTLRILTEIFYRKGSERSGMNPTRALLDGVMKYKRTHSEFRNPENHFIYDYQKKYVDYIYQDLKYADFPVSDFNLFRSIECQIMDWADDAAYAVNDIVDSISAGFLSVIRLTKWGEENSGLLTADESKYLKDVIGWIKDGTYKQKFGTQIGEFIQACKITERKTFCDEVTNRYKYLLNIDEEIKNRNEFYKRISFELVFNSPQLHQMEFKAAHLLKRMFDAFVENYTNKSKPEKLLPEFSHAVICREPNSLEKIRLICDQIAGMTDSYAVRTYRRLFEPDYGSLADLI